MVERATTAIRQNVTRRYRRQVPGQRRYLHVRVRST